MNKIKLVIWREFGSRIKKRSFILMSLLGPILISLFAILAIEVSESYEPYNVAVIDTHYLTNKAEYQNTRWCTFDYFERNLTDEEFKDSKYDVLIYINRKFATNNTIQAIYKEKPNPYARADILREMELRLEKLKLDINNISHDAYDRIKQRVVMKEQLVDGKEISFRQNAGNVGFVFGFLIFLFVFNFGIQVLKGVIEEKSSRIVEIIISSVSPVQLMTGKIIGIGLTALTQFIIWTGLTAVIMIGVKDYVFPDVYAPEKQIVQSSTQGDQPFKAPEQIQVNEVGSLIYEAVNYPGMLMYFLFFLIFGYLFYAAIFASIGAAVDNDTDSQQFLFPVTLPLIFSFVVSWLAITQPDNTLVSWFSQIPFTSPVVMMVRLPLIAGTESFWEVYVSMGILVVSVIFMFILSARVYRTGILMYGKKASIREIWRWALKG